MTQRLYYQNWRLLHFEAEVISCREHNGFYHAEFDATAFYPMGGGQPADRGQVKCAGTVADLVDCIDLEDRVVHVLTAPVDGRVSCEVDAVRRRDHMQQHTGQHILSQAFLQLARAKTCGFHIGEESSTIDIDLEHLAPELLEQVETLANTIVFENRQVRVLMLPPEDMEKYDLRRQTTRAGIVRLIEIDGYDVSPCGGTHAHATGEVGLIVVRSLERVKRTTRVEFLCGMRALSDYRTANRTATATAALFSAARARGPELVRRLQQEQKRLEKRLREVLEAQLDYEAAHLLAEAGNPDLRVVTLYFKERDLDELKLLAHKLAAHHSVIALLGSGTRLVFARSADVQTDCGKLLAELCRELGGRGGGRPDFAQGGVESSNGLEEALKSLSQRVRNL